MCYVLCEERKLKIYSFYCASPFIATAGDNERKRRRERSLFEFIDPCGGQSSESIGNSMPKIFAKSSGKIPKIENILILWTKFFL